LHFLTESIQSLVKLTLKIFTSTFTERHFQDKKVDSIGRIDFMQAHFFLIVEAVVKIWLEAAIFVYIGL